MNVSLQTAGDATPNEPPAQPSVSEESWIDIAGVRSLTCMSASWIHDAVRAEKFPKPVIRGHRCTRWRTGDVLAYMRQRAGR